MSQSKHDPVAKQQVQHCEPAPGDMADKASWVNMSKKD
jgi:hypothetical protein